MDALRRSVAGSKNAKSTAMKSAPKKGRKWVAGQGDVLLPISGRRRRKRLSLLHGRVRGRRGPANYSFNAKNVANS
jgi:hypothetical protein